jgi:hypothetical protein
MSPVHADALIAELQAAFAAAPWAAYRIKWSVLRQGLVENDPEAIAYVHEKLAETPARIAQQQAAAAAEAEEAAYEARGLDLDELSYYGPAIVDRKARGQIVWVYHGTTTRFLDDILQQGLLAGVNRIDAKVSGIYVTARPGGGLREGGTARWYAERAAGYFGGDPVVLRLLLPYNELDWDTDDEDIQTGNYQWVIDYVPPSAIYEVNGESIR